MKRATKSSGRQPGSTKLPAQTRQRTETGSTTENNSGLRPLNEIVTVPDGVPLDVTQFLQVDLSTLAEGVTIILQDATLPKVAILRKRGTIVAEVFAEVEKSPLFKKWGNNPLTAAFAAAFMNPSDRAALKWIRRVEYFNHLSTSWELLIDEVTKPETIIDTIRMINLCVWETARIILRETHHSHRLQEKEFPYEPEGEENA